MSNKIINTINIILEKYFQKRIIDIGYSDIHDHNIPDEIQMGEYS